MWKLNEPNSADDLYRDEYESLDMTNVELYRNYI